MSIIIKGMEMPSGCETCKLKYRNQGAYVVDYCFPYIESVDPWTFGKERNGDKPSWCPLVEIPPHGRLIDADALEEEPCDVVEDRDWYSVFGYSHDQIRNAPTIIEAEEEEE